MVICICISYSLSSRYSVRAVGDLVHDDILGVGDDRILRILL